MNGYAVQDEWVKYEQRQHRRRQQRLDAERARKASAWVAEQMPDLVVDGRVCDWAIRAALQVATAARRGECRFTVAEVRANRRRSIELMLARTGMTAEELQLRL